MIRQDIQVILSASDLLALAKTETERENLIRTIKEKIKKIDRQLDQCRSDADLSHL